MDYIKYFEQNKYVHVPNLINSEVCNFLYNYFVIKACTNQVFNPSESKFELQQPYVKAVYGDIAGETILSQNVESLSQVTGKTLCPTYSYSRVYLKGETLYVHRDRPSCEFSCTVNLGGAPWPIHFGVYDDNSEYQTYCDHDKKMKKVKKLASIQMNPGDGIIYKGEELLHWRDPLEGDHCVQTFIHYIDQNGPHYPEWKYDKRLNIGFLKNNA